MGEPGSPMVTSGPMRGAHNARCKRPGSAGVPPASRLRGQGDDPRPSPPPLGEGVRLLPPAGGGWEGGSILRTMFTSGPLRGAHSARYIWPGCAGIPPASRLPGHGDGPLPDPPPLGAGVRLLPPAGGGWEGGQHPANGVHISVRGGKKPPPDRHATDRAAQPGILAQREGEGPPFRHGATAALHAMPDQTGFIIPEGAGTTQERSAL